jgi:hypothetical protein
VAKGHCIVWLDHEKAHMAFFDRETTRTLAFRAKENAGHVHLKSGVIGSGKHSLDPDFAKAIESEVAACRELMLVGPGTAKLEFMRHAFQHAPELEKKIIGIETADEMTDRQLAYYGWSFFQKYDRLHSSNEDVLAGLAAHRQ